MISNADLVAYAARCVLAQVQRDCAPIAHRNPDTLAEDRMTSTNDSIAEIAQSLGYESATAFAKFSERLLVQPIATSSKISESCC